MTMSVENVLLKQITKQICQCIIVNGHGHALAREASQIQSYEQLTWKESSFIGKGSKRRKERMQLDQGSPLNSKKKRKERIVLGQMKLAVSSKNEIDRLTTHGERVCCLLPGNQHTCRYID